MFFLNEQNRTLNGKNLLLPLLQKPSMRPLPFLRSANWLCARLSHSCCHSFIDTNLHWTITIPRSWTCKRIPYLNCQDTKTCMVQACSHAMTASQKPSFRASWRVGDAVVGRGNAGWTTSKSGRHCQCQNCSQLQGPHAEKTGRGSLLNRPPCPPDDPVGQGTELNCNDMCFTCYIKANSQVIKSQVNQIFTWDVMIYVLPFISE